jgi:hypothetical protein
MIEAVAEIAIWFAFWNLGEAAEEDPRVPVWKRVLLSVLILTIVAAGVLFVARANGII